MLLLQVAYYRLYGRLADGSNVKVRLSDKAYPGLGIEVYPHDIIMMSHLLIVVLRSKHFEIVGICWAPLPVESQKPQTKRSVCVCCGSICQERRAPGSTDGTVTGPVQSGNGADPGSHQRRQYWANWTSDCGMSPSASPTGMVLLLSGTLLYFCS